MTQKVWPNTHEKKRRRKQVKQRQRAKKPNNKQTCKMMAIAAAQ